MPGTGRGRGRPRSEAADAAILESVVDLIAESGVSSVTFEGVADRSGVGKTTIYRRWSTKTELLRAAIDQLAEAEAWAEPADAGDLRAELLELVTRYVRMLTKTRLGAILPSLVAHGPRDPQLARALRSDIARRRRAARRILERASERGELSGDVDYELAIDTLLGPVVYRLLITARSMGPRSIERLVDQVCTGIEVEGAR